MPKSLAELQSSPDVGLPERVVRVCVAARLVRDLEQTDAELFEVETQIEALEKQEQARREGDAPPQRAGQKSGLTALVKRGRELAAKSDDIRARMEEHMVDVLLRGHTKGEWRRWANQHPARDEAVDPQGFDRDRRWSGAHVNIDELSDDLGRWIVKCNDEDASEAWVQFLATNGAPAHLLEAASHVVAMHEQPVSLGKGRSEWFTERRSATTSG